MVVSIGKDVTLLDSFNMPNAGWRNLMYRCSIYY